MSAERDRWIRRLRTAAARAPGNDPLTHAATREAQAEFVRTFADERGHRREIDRDLLAFMLQRPDLASPAGPKERPPQAGARVDSLDLLLWRALSRGGPAPPHLLATRGPLIAELATIETTTEAELAALHALGRIAQRDDDAALRARCFDAARAAIEQLQPDNATGHPWAIAIFAELGLQTGDAAARHYAETLEHNCMITLGRPDRFSAVLLLDAAAMLESAATGGAA